MEILQRKKKRADAGGPIRMCVICRRRLLKAELTRYRVTPDGVLFDEKQIGPGRGWYVCSDGKCMQKFHRFFMKNLSEGGCVDGASSRSN
ncbi:MAG: DUF448 domain-containing protein [Desulfovibrio sp.]|nr:DUF448 domain-containing protein [Desulfovibrio sp.]